MADIVKRVDTRGCHPLTMLHKLADTGAIEILENEKHTKYNCDYHYRTIVKVNDNLYLEAYDPLNELLGVGERRFYTYIQNETVRAGVLSGGKVLGADIPARQELLESDWNWGVSPTGYKGHVWSGILAPDLDSVYGDTAVIIPKMALSCAYNRYLHNSTDGYLCTTDTPEYLEDYVVGGEVFYPWLSPATSKHTGRVSLSNPNGIQRTVTITVSPVPPVYTTQAFSCGEVQANRPLRPAVAAASSSTKTSLDTSYKLLGLTRFHGEDSIRCGHAYLMSGAMLRVSREISAEGALVSPTEWNPFPVHVIGMVLGDDGLLFHIPSTNNNSFEAYWHVGVLDTTRGNGFGEGKCPVITRFNRMTGGAASAVTGDLTQAQGLVSPLGGAKVFSQYAPVPPIGSDSFTGGPVVASLFASSADELRGVFPAFLSCNTSLAVGTMGWLDGKRYRVFRPGMMMRVG